MSTAALVAWNAAWMGRIGNALVLWLLGSPLHRMLSAKVVVVAYDGRRSGRSVRLPVQYAALADQIVVFPARAASKRWWRNFEQPHAATILLAGRTIRALGAVVREPEQLDPLAAAYQGRFPSAREIRTLLGGVHACSAVISAVEKGMVDA